VSGIPNVGVFLARNTIAWTRQIDAPATRAWDAITLKEHLDEWYMVEDQTEFRLGGKHTWWQGGTVDEFELMRGFRLSMPSVNAWQRWAVEPVGDGALFTFTDRLGDDFSFRPKEEAWEETENGWRQLPGQPVDQRQQGGLGTHWVGFAAGYHSFVDALDTHLTGKSNGYESHERLCVLYDAWYDVFWSKGGRGADLVYGD
jgi:uncharacterized protein YndB with AHSA1/START domain